MEKCEDYGNRMKDYLKCQECPDEILENCSILTLEKVLSKSKRDVTILTTKGKKLKLE